MPPDPSPGRPRLLSVRDWPFAWKLRGAVLLLVLISAVGAAAMLGYTRRSRELTRTLAARELAGLGLVLNVDRDGYQAVLGLTQAAAAPSAEERGRWLAFYRENIGQTRERLEGYIQLPGLSDARIRAAGAAAASRGRFEARGDAVAGALERTGAA
ncbi:MAG TPA: hypothetical protein VFX98_17795, partial [Longimicrobiaceae bacterium]|nr:hypothetical protein [Longimicrobiaceae bacterium]